MWARAHRCKPATCQGHPSATPPPPRSCHCRRSERGRGGWGNDAPCSPCAMRTGPPRASRAGGRGGCGTAAPGTTRSTLSWCQRRGCAIAHTLRDGRRVRAPPPPLWGAATMRRWPRRGQAPARRPQGALGAPVGAMGRQRGKTPYPGASVLLSRRDLRGGGGPGGGGGAARPRPRTPSLNPTHSVQDFKHKHIHACAHTKNPARGDMGMVANIAVVLEDPSICYVWDQFDEVGN